MSCTCDDFSGKANKRISIQSATEVPDEFGGRSTVWAETLSCWAHIEPMAGREMFISAQMQSRVDARMTIRFNCQLQDTTNSAKRRAVFQSRVYNIKAVKNLAIDMKSEGTAFQQLLCVEGEGS